MKPRNNGFFDESDTLNSQRANAMNSDKMIDDLNILEQWINSNANTDRGHYHNLLMHQDWFDLHSIKQKEALIIESDSSKDTKFK